MIDFPRSYVMTKRVEIIASRAFQNKPECCDCSIVACAHMAVVALQHMCSRIQVNYIDVFIL